MRASRRVLGVVWLGLCACPTPAASDEAATASESGGSSSTSSTGGSTSTTSTSGQSPEPVTTTGAAPDGGGCGHDTPEALMGCVETRRWSEDVALIAHSRPPGSPHWQMVQDRCAAALEQAGFTVQRQAYASGVNVVGTLPGTTSPDEVVLLAAHYDHIGGCPGADDNASGVAGALEVARVLGQAALPRTVVVACWDEEELGLRGSRAFAQGLTGPMPVVAFNFDMIGVASEADDSQVFPGPLAERFPELQAELVANRGRANFIAVVADGPAEAFARELEGLAESLGRLTGVMALTAAEKLDEDDFGVLTLSDHRSFWERDIPALHVFDTGVFRYPGYHCTSGLDTPDRLDAVFAADVMKATAAAMASAAGL
ncbi:M28 family metallopeptidase [Nannocystis pusilla]|uniref:M20/M25/M40 family metallo-hydrolase n=1 Tax=Nannocystis pusilla TaxID=889268 RepID=A0ABS7U186_9BACT|nr:M20/M25/M40 family metallo-hydrolase [Nannocystis pusilla]MBZ5714115.1 M20/M25/M40 family metallo-hydrolase [Nannocystis pusilla]